MHRFHVLCTVSASLATAGACGSVDPAYVDADVDPMAPDAMVAPDGDDDPPPPPDAPGEPDAAVPAFATITVRDLDGAPIAGAQVLVHDVAGVARDAYVTGATGVVVPQVEPGDAVTVISEVSSVRSIVTRLGVQPGDVIEHVHNQQPPRVVTEQLDIQLTTPLKPPQWGDYVVVDDGCTRRVVTADSIAAPVELGLRVPCHDPSTSAAFPVVAWNIPEPGGAPLAYAWLTNVSMGDGERLMPAWVYEPDRVRYEVPAAASVSLTALGPTREEIDGGRVAVTGGFDLLHAHALSTRWNQTASVRSGAVNARVDRRIRGGAPTDFAPGLDALLAAGAGASALVHVVDGRLVADVVAPTLAHDALTVSVVWNQGLTRWTVIAPPGTERVVWPITDEVVDLAAATASATAIDVDVVTDYRAYRERGAAIALSEHDPTAAEIDRVTITATVQPPR